MEPMSATGSSCTLSIALAALWLVCGPISCRDFAAQAGSIQGAAGESAKVEGAGGAEQGVRMTEDSLGEGEGGGAGGTSDRDDSGGASGAALGGDAAVAGGQAGAAPDAIEMTPDMFEDWLYGWRLHPSSAQSKPAI